MLSNRSIGFRSFFALASLALVTISFWVWLAIWENVASFDKNAIDKYFLYNEFLLIGILFGSGNGHRQSQGPQHEFVDAMRRSARQSVLGMFCVLALVFALHDNFASRSFFISYIPWLFLTMLFVNYLTPKWLSKWFFSGNREERVALAGTLEQASKIESWLKQKRLLGFRSVGVIFPQPAGAAQAHHNGNGNGAPLRALGSMDEMDQILEKESITQVIVLDLALGQERLHRLTQLCEGRNIRLLALDNRDSYFNHSTTVFEDDGVRVIGLREEPLENPACRFVKRAVDIIVALPVVVLVLPLASLLVWLCQRRQSPGPVLFCQERIGMMGQEFRMYKYRSMHINHGDEARQATKTDDRVFPAGRWMRRLSIDELPQFINVLKGDMSVVGPRPHLRRHEELWSRAMRKYVIRRFVRPGITGYAQVKGYRGEVHNLADIEKRVEMDIYYLENWSFSLDVAVILKTIKHCALPSKNAY